MKKFPNTFIVKFPGEFMFPCRWWLYVKSWALGSLAPRKAIGDQSQWFAYQT
jgi:hypothetical protein